jgi:hypothetical protein
VAAGCEEQPATSIAVTAMMMSSRFMVYNFCKEVRSAIEMHSRGLRDHTTVTIGFLEAFIISQADRRLYGV